MDFMTPTHWLIVAICVIILVLIAARALSEAWDRAEEQLEYRTANWSDIEHDTNKLQSMVPSPRRSHQIAPTTPPTPQSRFHRRRLMNQYEVAGAAAALVDLAKGVRRANPCLPGSPQALGWSFGYEQARMEREHQTADAKPPRHMNLIQCTGDREYLKESTGDRRFWAVSGPGSA